MVLPPHNELYFSRLNGGTGRDYRYAIATEPLHEGWAEALNDAWAAATAAAGTDELHPVGAGPLGSVVSARAWVRRQERLANAKPSAADSAKVRYLYSHEPSRYINPDPFPYRRYRIVRETKLCFFVEDNNGDLVDRNGNPQPDGERRFIRVNEENCLRIRKAAFEMVDPYAPVGSAYLGSGWSSRLVWLTLGQAVALGDSRSAQLQVTDWREVLGLPVDGFLSVAQVRRAYRTRLFQVHPDHGGDADEFARVQRAFEEGKRLVEVG
jgi:hypothetical protein